MQYFNILLFLFFSFSLKAQENIFSTELLKEDFNQLLTDIQSNYIYLDDKSVDLECIETTYSKQIDTIKNEREAVLLFEYLLNEFYDSHLILNTNTQSSFRLYSPIYAKYENDEVIIKNIWKSQVEKSETPIINAQITEFNGIPINEMIEQFPAYCNTKNTFEVKEWIVNKILSGKYNERRILTLKLENNTLQKLDLDKLEIRFNETLLNINVIDSIGIITINNSLGNNNLVNAFDIALDSLSTTKALILDLRNTVDGGNSYVARGIMGRFIDTPKPYQKHWLTERYDNNPKIEHSWLEVVSPRLKTYSKPLIVLVGRWTGSMGEGITIGFDGMQRADIVGTEMERLAGAMQDFAFKNRTYGYRLSTEKLFHLNGIPREKFVPQIYIKQTNSNIDEHLQKALLKIKQIR